VRRPAPLFGEHTRDVLAETGFTRDEIERLFREGAVRETAAPKRAPSP
jgi:formyl-CoA transferase